MCIYVHIYVYTNVYINIYFVRYRSIYLHTYLSPAFSVARANPLVGSLTLVICLVYAPALSLQIVNVLVRGSKLFPAQEPSK